MGKRQPTYFQNRNGWVSESANETGKTGATLPPRLPAMFRAFEPDDSVDPPCQETPGFSLSLTLIIQKDEERRSVYAGQNDAFAVVIEIGRLITCQSPDAIGCAPPVFRGLAQILWQSQKRLRPAQRLPMHFHHRSEEHTSELQSLMRISYAVFCLKKKKT